MMNGTFAWPDESFWNDKILVLETSEAKLTPGKVGYVLRNFGLQDILERVRGLLFAKPKSYSSEGKARHDARLLRIPVDEFGCRDLATDSNIDLGHTEPRHILPYGIELEIDPGTESIAFRESFYQWTNIAGERRAYEFRIE